MSERDGENAELILAIRKMLNKLLSGDLQKRLSTSEKEESVWKEAQCNPTLICLLYVEQREIWIGFQD